MVFTCEAMGAEEHAGTHVPIHRRQLFPPPKLYTIRRLVYSSMLMPVIPRDTLRQ